MRARRNIYFEHEQARVLERLAATHGLSVSAVVGRTVASFLSPDAEHQHEAAVTRRLDRLTRQLERLERDHATLVETPAPLLRHHFLGVPPVAEWHAHDGPEQGTGVGRAR